MEKYFDPTSITSESHALLVIKIDLGETRRYLDHWNIFRDWRLDLYSRLMTLDEESKYRCQQPGSSKQIGLY